MQLTHFQLRPGGTHIFIKIFIGSVDKLVIGKIWEKNLNGGSQSQLQIPKQGQSTNNSQSLLKIRPGDLTILLFHLIGNFNLFKVTHPKKHPLLPLNSRLKIKKIVILHLIMRRIWHRMVHYQILNILCRFWLRVFILNFSPTLMVEMNHRHTNNRLVYFVIPLVILIHHFL